MVSICKHDLTPPSGSEKWGEIQSRNLLNHSKCPEIPKVSSIQGFLSPLAVEVRAHTPVVESLQQEGAHAGPGTPSNGVTEDKSLQTVTVVRLSIQDVKYLLIQTLSLGRGESFLALCMQPMYVLALFSILLL